MIIALLITLILFLAPDFCIFGAFLRNVPLVWRILFFVPSVLGLASLFGMRYCGFSSAFGTIVSARTSPTSTVALPPFGMSFR